MKYLINRKVVFVQGAKNGAIYDFNTGKVFSINNEACRILKAYINKELMLSDDAYLQLLFANQLINESFLPIKYQSVRNFDNRLEMAWLEITQKCNLRCIHCYEGQEHVSFKNTLTLAELKSVIDQLAAENVNWIIVIDGEPCCHKNINEILAYATQYPMEVTLFTNATMIDESLLRTIVKNNIKVKISVYGHTEEIHDNITKVKGSYAKLLESVKELKNRNIDVTASIVAMKENEEYIDKTIEFVKSIGMNFKRYDVIRSVYKGTQTAHIPRTNKVLDYAYFKRPNFWTTEEQFEKNHSLNTCWYGKIAIMENGDVLPCEFERNYKYGNVRKETIKQILRKEETTSKWWLCFDKIEICKDCEYRYACHDCRALGISVCGSMTTKNPRCLYNPYEGKWEEKNE